jgi:hypothetical protein
MVPLLLRPSGTMLAGGGSLRESLDIEVPEWQSFSSSNHYRGKINQ